MEPDGPRNAIRFYSALRYNGQTQPLPPEPALMKLDSLIPPSLRTFLSQPKVAFGFALGLGALGLAAVLIFHASSPRTTAQRQVRAFFALHPDQVYSLELQGPKEHIVLKRSTQGWRLVEPVDDKVNTGTVFALLADLCDWQTLQVVPESENQKDWGFNSQGWRITLRNQAGQAWTVQVGWQESATGQYYARRADERKVYLVRLPEELVKPEWAQRLRDHNLFAEPLTDIRQMTFRDEHAAITLAWETAAPSSPELPRFGSARDSRVPSAPRWIISHPFYVPADPEVMAEVLGAVSQWEVEACVEESVGARTDLGKFGLTEPCAAIVLHQTTRRYPLELVFGQPEGIAGPLYVKSSLEAKIFRLAPGALDQVQALLSHVASRRLIFFWDEVEQCEIVTSHWRIALKREPKGWQAVSVRKPSLDAGAGGPRGMKPAEEPAPYFFKAAPVVEKLKRLEYLEVLTDRHPYSADYRQAVRVMHIQFLRATGNLLEDFVLLEAPKATGVLFLQRQNDDLVYLVSQSEVQALLTKALPPEGRPKAP
jgi:hypothetical protein